MGTSSTETQLAIGNEIWKRLEPHAEQVIVDTYQIAAKIRPQQQLMSWETKKMSLVCRADFGNEFKHILSKIVQGNIGAGIDYATYTIGYGVYESQLISTLVTTFTEEDPAEFRKQIIHHILFCTHREMSLALGHFFEHAENKATKEREKLANAFESEIISRLKHVDHTLDLATENMFSVQNQSKSAEARCVEALNKTQEASSHVEAVASAASQLNTSTGELAEKASTAANASDAARTGATSAETTVTGLADESGRIADVVNLIRSIADQTRMLALNATIEAARAGEAGQGFAVVASEVKNLAKDTSAATDRIGKRVEAINKSAVEARRSMTSVSESVGELAEISAALSTLGEEQNKTTAEIACKTNQSVTNMRAAKSDAQALADFARSATAQSQEMARLLEAVRNATHALNISVKDFLRNLRGQGSSMHTSDNYRSARGS